MLSGVRVVDLAHMLAGGYGSMLLGDLGAEVIKIEPPGNRRPHPAVGATLRGGGERLFPGHQPQQKERGPGIEEGRGALAQNDKLASSPR
jgi:hypothetical protein